MTDSVRGEFAGQFVRGRSHGEISGLGMPMERLRARKATAGGDRKVGPVMRACPGIGLLSFAPHSTDYPFLSPSSFLVELAT
jgi:hypothetical protein